MNLIVYGDMRKGGENDLSSQFTHKGSGLLKNYKLYKVHNKPTVVTTKYNLDEVYVDIYYIPFTYENYFNKLFNLHGYTKEYTDVDIGNVTIFGELFKYAGCITKDNYISSGDWLKQ